MRAIELQSQSSLVKQVHEIPDNPRELGIAKAFHFGTFMAAKFMMANSLWQLMGAALRSSISYNYSDAHGCRMERFQKIDR
jgi:hypothetical protein